MSNDERIREGKLEFYYVKKGGERLEPVVLSLKGDDNLKENVKSAIKKFRGKNYVYPKNSGAYGDQYKDLLPAGVVGFKTYIDEELISPACNGNKEIFEGVDIRRVVSEILKTDAAVQVTKLSIAGKEYRDIKNIRNHKNRICFDAWERDDDKEEQVTACVPIDISRYSSRIVTESIEDGLYILKSSDVDLDIYEMANSSIHRLVDPRYNEKVRLHEEIKPEHVAYVDLFYGQNKGKRGVFFYYQGKLYSKYSAEKVTDYRYKLYYSDIRKSFEYCGSYGNSLDRCIASDNLLKENISFNLEREEEEFFDERILEDREVMGYLDSVVVVDKERTERFVEWMQKNIIRDLQCPPEGHIYLRELTPFHKMVQKYTISSNEFIMYNFNSQYIVAIRENKGNIHTDYSSFEWADYGRFRYELDEEGRYTYLWLSAKSEDYVLSYDNLNVSFSKLMALSAIKEIIDGMEKLEDTDLQNVTSWGQRNKDKIISIIEYIDRYPEVKAYLEKKSISGHGMNDYIIRRDLYREHEIVDDVVVRQVGEMLNGIKQDNRLPNIALLGPEGSGKNTLAKRLVKVFGDVYGQIELVIKNASDLKGAYVGHTSARIFDMLKEADEKNQVILLNEAYNIDEDSFGKEALAIILSAMSGDRRVIEKPSVNNEPAESYQLKNTPCIWISGDEDKLRHMLSKNIGLYRSMTKIKLKTPSVADMYELLLVKVDEKLKSIIERCQDAIKNYLGWATSREFINYFGNYEGIDDLAKALSLRLHDEKLFPDAKGIILQVLDEKKTEIKCQYKSALKELEKIEFEVQNDINTTLADVKGNDKVVGNVKHIVDMLSNSKEYLERGIAIPKGMLLVGPPGTGKTLIARAMAGQVQKKYKEKDNKDVRIGFIATIATELDSTKKIEALFQEASEYDTCIIFIDEIDAIGKHRNMPGAVPPLLIQLMKELDGFEERKNVFVVAATNDPDSLDPALKRPGRFDRLVEIGYPEEKGRVDILKLYLEKLSGITFDVDKLAEVIGKETVGYTPSELKNLVNEAAILYEKCKLVTDDEVATEKHRERLAEDATEEDKFLSDIYEIIERQRVGELSAKGKEDKFQIEENDGSSAVAIHEVGHALVSVLQGVEPFDKVTVISRGDALGYVSHNVDTKINTKRKILSHIKICLGGRIAEEMFYGDDISIGAVSDIRQATSLAEDMVTMYGMSEDIGPMAIKRNNYGYLGDSSTYTCSDGYRARIEEEVNKILREQMELTRELLKDKKELIATLAEYIFHNEVVTGQEFVEKYNTLIG